ncbi:30S ribosomal protein S20 [Patescibacteria group bacterium]|nr:30S ribosomal protein S20 [Patescibacteria group bacterium]
MPIIKSAIKKVRKDKVRTTRNKSRETALKSAVKKARVSKTAKDLQTAFSALDKAAKVHLIHPNKAARLKSRLSKGSGAVAKKSK